MSEEPLYQNRSLRLACLLMSARNPGYLSRANGAKLVVDHFWRGWRLIKMNPKRAPYSRNLRPGSKCLGSEVGSYSRLTNFCVTQL